MFLVFDLPYPPSVNHYWRTGQGRHYISAEGRSYRAAVQATVREAFPVSQPRPIDGPVSLRVEVFPPDRRRRDLDNVLKALLDALTFAGVWTDDSLVADLRIWRGGQAPGGKCRVTIAPLAEEKTA